MHRNKVTFTLNCFEKMKLKIKYSFLLLLTVFIYKTKAFGQRNKNLASEIVSQILTLKLIDKHFPANADTLLILNDTLEINEFCNLKYSEYKILKKYFGQKKVCNLSKKKFF
jgi:hypothetical protein